MVSRYLAIVAKNRWNLLSDVERRCIDTKSMFKAILLICLGIGLAVPSIYGAYQAITIQNTGFMGVVGAFTDVALTQPVSSFAWGTVYPGTTVNQTVYLKNFSGNNVTVTMAVSNWTPFNASQYMTVTWDHQNSILYSGVAEQTTLSLTMLPSAVNSTISGFSFVITINPS